MIIIYSIESNRIGADTLILKSVILPVVDTVDLIGFVADFAGVS